MNETFTRIAEEIKAGTFTNIWKQGVEIDDKLTLDDVLAKAQSNAMVRRVMKEAVLSDAFDALAAINAQVIEPTDQMAIAREIIWMLPVTTPSTRFYKRTKGGVWRIAEGPPPLGAGRWTPLETTLKYEYGEDALFGQSYLEDCPFGVIEKELAECGQLLEEQLTTDVIALYDGITAANLASGAVVDTATSGKLAWADIVTGWRVFKQSGFSKKPGRKVLIVSPWEVEDLFNDDKFLNALYPASSLLDIQRGVIGNIFGFTVVESDMMADDGGGDNGNYAYMLNADIAAVCTMRRNKLVQPYTEKLSEGVIATNRYGMRTLREESVVRFDIVHA